MISIRKLSTRELQRSCHSSPARNPAARSPPEYCNRSSQENEPWDSADALPLPCQSSQRHPRRSPLSLKPQMLPIEDVFLEIIDYQVAGNIEIIDY